MSVSLESLLVLEVAEAEGSDSITASARSEIRKMCTQFSMPGRKANSLFSMSISSRVSMCSLTQLKWEAMIHKMSKQGKTEARFLEHSLLVVVVIYKDYHWDT